MSKYIPRIICVFLLLVLTACDGGNPGPLEGTWKMKGIVPMTITFRSGETEALGIIEKVSYEIKNNTVLVTYENGLMKGTSMRYTIINQNTVKSSLGTLRKIR